nr:hypothetical protein [Tanacetum cinerariifolium]
MIMYLKNVTGFRLDYFKGMSYDDIRPIFKAKFNSNIEFLLKSKEHIEEEENRGIQSINETPAQKAAKRMKLNEEVEDLKQHLEIMPDEDDDVHTEATPLARKVSVIDYEIIHFNNKPHYKIIRANGTHQLYEIPTLKVYIRSIAECSKVENGRADFGVDAAMDHEENTKCLMLLVKQKKDGIFISQDKYVAEILRKFGLTEGKSASTPIDTEKPLLKDPDGEDVDVHTYRPMIGSLMYLTSSIPDIMFAVCYRKQTVVATSSIEAEYIAATSCCAHVLWIQNQLLDYGDSPLLGVNTPRSDEDRLEILELTVFVLPKLMLLEGVDCLPNEEIFAEMARMGAKRTSWNEFSSAMASTVICLSTGRKFNFSKYIFERIVRNVDSSSKFYMYPRRVGKGFSRVETPLFAGMLVIGENVEEEDVQEQSIPSPTLPPHPPQDLPSTSSVQPTPPPSPQPQPLVADFPFGLLQTALDTCVALTSRIEQLEFAKISQALEISKLEKRMKRLEKSNKGRMTNELDRDEGVALTAKKEEERKTKEAKNSAGDDQVKGRQTEICQIDMDHPSKVLSMQEDEPAEVQEVVEVVTTAKLITEVVAASIKRRKGVVIRDPEKESTAKTLAETKSKDKGKGIMVEEPKPMKKKQQVEIDEEYARKLHEELNQDIDWDVAIDHVKQKVNEDPYVLDYFKEMSYDDIRPIFEAKFITNIEFLLKSKERIEEEERRVIESINETHAQKAAKRRKLNKEVAKHNKHFESVPDEDDDVFTKATLFARKVPVVDYSIIFLNNKPNYKIVKADGTNQLYISFLTLLKNFDRDDLESLWNIVKERFSTTKPDNFTNDFY